MMERTIGVDKEDNTAICLLNSGCFRQMPSIVDSHAMMGEKVPANWSSKRKPSRLTPTGVKKYGRYIASSGAVKMRRRVKRSGGGGESKW